MSKLKKWLLAGGLLIIIGGLLFVIGMSALKWDFYKLDTTEYTAKNFTVSEEITGVDFNVDTFPVVIKSGSSFTLDYYEASDSNVEVTIENGILKIYEKHKPFDLLRKSWFSFGRLNHVYELTLPADVALDFTGANGDVKFEGVSLSSVTLDITNADLMFNNCNFFNLGVKLTNGDIEFYDCTADTVTVNSTNIDFEAINCNFSSLTVKGTNADVSVIKSTVPEISLSSTNADYVLRNVNVDNLTVKGTNLDAYILINGEREDYTVTVNNEIKSTGRTDKTVNVIGTNRDVDLKWNSTKED